jgi:N-acyl-D-amino-acid deacylase
MRPTILIRHCAVIDGSGSLGIIADIAIDSGRIVALGQSLAVDANKVIDTNGLTVTPGFIDIKTHCDFVLRLIPKPKASCAGRSHH